jgi:hypothetical protein
MTTDEIFEIIVRQMDEAEELAGMFISNSKK